MSVEKKVTGVYCIRKYFSQEDKISPMGGRPVTMDELKELGAGRKELGELCAKELGLTIGDVLS